MIKGKRKILIVGASSDMAVPLNKQLYSTGAILGLHYRSNVKVLGGYHEMDRVKKFKKNLACSKDCYGLVDDFVDWAEGIDCLVQLSGMIKGNVHWEKLSEKEWRSDLNANLLTSFFIAQRAVKHMKEKGGRIVLMSTASASHGGGANSLAYGVAKAGVECIVKRLAKDCAKYNILVNAVAPGFILTKAQKQVKRTAEDLKKRTETIPLKRPGTVEEVSSAIMFLLSEQASYITGQVIPVSGGDWL